MNFNDKQIIWTIQEKYIDGLIFIYNRERGGGDKERDLVWVFLGKTRIREGEY